MFREEARVWSIKFPAAPEFTSAVETVHEGQKASVIETKKEFVRVPSGPPCAVLF